MTPRPIPGYFRLVFGCGEALAPGGLGFSADVVAAAHELRADRLRNSDEFDAEALDVARRARAEARTWLVGGLGVLGLLGSVAGQLRIPSGGGGTGSGSSATGRVHTLPSTSETVRLGVFDATLEDVLEIDSGDVVVYPNTWSHFLNRLQPGLEIDAIARLRRESPGRGPHSIVGPVGVRGAEAGDMLAIEFQRLVPVDWGATFVNPGDLGTGTLPDDFAAGQVRYLDLDAEGMRAEFLPGVSVPLAPFQGTFAVAPSAAGVVNSVPPGQHAGNIDLRELTAGSVLYIPVWQPGGK
ncbi:MAG: acetamidase/formamidase family protein, partial [Chloroflexota bacterium]|nr:acetamidase/formamidase family protein [Chloroflexota bacterium]